MATYLPYNSLLNHIYIPFHQLPEKKIYNCVDHFTSLETGFNNQISTIDLSLENGEQVFPFIDLSKYDPDTKDWFWYDSDGMPFREKYNSSWELDSVYDMGSYKNSTVTFSNPDELRYDSDGKELGFYSLGTVSGSAVNFYSGRPIFITINGEPLKDRTVYDEKSINNLTSVNVSSNKEFYYDSTSNKIYTNQNLSEVEPKNIKIYFYNIYNTVSVKCRLKSNNGYDSRITPIIDYYILKLNGQYLK